MLFKKIKILLLVAIYSVFLLLLFSETFISDFQEIRKNLIVDIHNKSETLVIPKSTWNSLSDKNEFKYKGEYYDVKSFVCYNEVVKVEVIKDAFEIILKTISKTPNSKSKKNHPLHGKKTIDFYFSKNPSIHLFPIYSIVNRNYQHPLHLQNSYLFSLFRPPLFH